jgi:hypothetical protein
VLKSVPISGAVHFRPVASAVSCTCSRSPQDSRSSVGPRYQCCSWTPSQRWAFSPSPPPPRTSSPLPLPRLRAGCSSPGACGTVPGGRRGNSFAAAGSGTPPPGRGAPQKIGPSVFKYIITVEAGHGNLHFDTF